MRKKYWHIVSTLLLSVVMGTAWMIHAQPARDRILTEVDLRITDGNTFLEIGLSTPFRYLSHFPQDKGTELRIRLQPIRVANADAGAVSAREGLRPDDADIAAIDEVLYEGDAVGGPQLTVRFTRPTRYAVIPGSDYRHVTIAILELK